MANIPYPEQYDDSFMNIFKRIIDELNSMGYTYEESLQKAQDILEEAKQTNDMNESVQQQINTLIAESGTSDAEVVQARIDADDNEYPVLKERLDEKEKNFSAQLAQTERIVKTVSGSRRTKRPLITWIDDDGHPAIFTKLAPKFKQINKPVTLGLVSGSSLFTHENRSDELQKLRDLVDNHGWEVSSHTHTHTPLTDFTNYGDLDNELGTSVKKLSNHGFTPNTLVYPNGRNNRLVREVASKYFSCAVVTAGGVNSGVLDTYRLNRQGFGAQYGLDSLDEYKAVVDEAVATNGWLIFMSHCGDTSDFTAEQENILVQLLDYIMSLDIDIVTLNEGYELVGNSIDIGDKEDETYFQVDAEGNFESPAISYRKISSDGINNSTQLNEFPSNTVSITTFLTGDNAGFPMDVGGTLETYNIVSNSLAFQSWYPIARPHKTFRRRWNEVTSQWTEWEEIGTVSADENIIHHKYNETDLITAYPNDQITYFRVNTDDGFGGNGIVTTQRLYGNGFDLQIFKGTNLSTEKRRYVKTDGSWSEWLHLDHGEPVNSRDGNALIGEYPSGFSFFYVNASANTGFPSSGTIITYNMGAVGFSNQIFRQYNSFNTYVRYVKTDGSWSEWKQVQMM